MKCTLHRNRTNSTKLPSLECASSSVQLILSSRWPRRARPCFPHNNTQFLSGTLAPSDWSPWLSATHYPWSCWRIEKDSHIEPRTRSFLSWRRDGNFSCHEQIPSAISFPKIWKALSQTAQNLLPSNLFWRKQCTGPAVYTIIMLTVMKPRVLLQPRWVKLLVWNRIGRMCAWKRWRIRIRLCGQDTLVFSAKLMQVDMWLHEFPNIILKSGGRLRGCTGSRLRAYTGVSDCSVWWTYRILFLHVMKLTVVLFLFVTSIYCQCGHVQSVPLGNLPHCYCNHM